MKKNILINVGDYYASATPAIIRTTLGSCVAVCLYDPVNRIGGMNHILLPGYPDLEVLGGSARYGVNAMELVVNRIMSLGGNRRYLTAKVFGGANVMDTLSKDYPIGTQNAEFVGGYLHKEGIRIVNCNTGGKDTRIIKFHTDTGEVFLKRLRVAEIPTLIFEEKKTLKRIEKEIKKPGKVELFKSHSRC